MGDPSARFFTLSVLEFVQFFQNLVGMAGDLRLDVGEDPAQLPLRIDDVGLPVRKGSESRDAEGGPVLLGNLPPLVGQHEKVQLLLRAELGVLFHRIDAHADDLRVEFAVALQIALEAPGLQRAPGGEGPRVEIEDRPLAVFHQGIEGYDPVSAGVGELKVGGLGAPGRDAAVGFRRGEGLSRPEGRGGGDA